MGTGWMGIGWEWGCKFIPVSIFSRIGLAADLSVVMTNYEQAVMLAIIYGHAWPSRWQPRLLLSPRPEHLAKGVPIVAYYC